MSFTRNTLLTAIVTFGTLAVVTQKTQACPPRGGGYSGGYSSQSYSSHNSPSYQNYSTPRYSGYSAPSPQYSQPTFSQTYSQPRQIAQPVQQFAQQSQVSQQQFVTQPQTPTPQQQQVAQQQQQQQTQAPQQQQQQQVAPQQAPIQNNNAAMSALQALGGFAPPATTPQQPQQQQVQTPAHVGNWTATLGNGSTVRLALQADGNFSWIATNKTGSSSSFSGTYTVSNGTLSLNRSNDGQTLGGSMTNSNNSGFSFKVAGNNAASINFARS